MALERHDQLSCSLVKGFTTRGPKIAFFSLFLLFIYLFIIFLMRRENGLEAKFCVATKKLPRGAAIKRERNGYDQLFCILAI